MNRKFNILMLIFVVMISGFLIIGCAPDTPAEPPVDDDELVLEKIVIGWTPPDITGVFQTATEYFELAAEDAGKYGIEVEVISRSPATHVAFADQVAIIEDYITMGVDVIAISPIEVEVVKPVLQQANAAGIPIIMVNLLEPIADVDIACYIGFDNFDGAAITAYSMVDYFGGPGVLGEGEKVTVTPETYLDLAWWESIYADADPAALNLEARGAIIEGVAGGFFSVTRVEGFRSVIDKFPGIVEVMEPIPADWNREKGIAAAEDILAANPEGTLDWIWAASNEMGMGARLACESAGRTEVVVFTNDVTPESVLEFINKDRIVAETTHGFPDWGWFGTKYAVMLALGLDVPQFEDIRPRTAYKANSHMFYPEPVLPAIDWEEILVKAGLK